MIPVNPTPEIKKSFSQTVLAALKFPFKLIRNTLTESISTNRSEVAEEAVVKDKLNQEALNIAKVSNDNSKCKSDKQVLNREGLNLPYTMERKEELIKKVNTLPVKIFIFSDCFGRLLRKPEFQDDFKKETPSLISVETVNLITEMLDLFFIIGEEESLYEDVLDLFVFETSLIKLRDEIKDKKSTPEINELFEFTSILISAIKESKRTIELDFNIKGEIIKLFGQFELLYDIIYTDRTKVRFLDEQLCNIKIAKEISPQELVVDDLYQKLFLLIDSEDFLNNKLTSQLLKDISDLSKLAAKSIKGLNELDDGFKNNEIVYFEFFNVLRKLIDDLNIIFSRDIYSTVRVDQDNIKTLINETPELMSKKQGGHANHLINTIIKALRRSKGETQAFIEPWNIDAESFSSDESDDNYKKIRILYLKANNFLYQNKSTNSEDEDEKILPSYFKRLIDLENNIDISKACISDEVEVLKRIFSKLLLEMGAFTIAEQQ